MDISDSIVSSWTRNWTLSADQFCRQVFDWLLNLSTGFFLFEDFHLSVQTIFDDNLLESAIDQLQVDEVQSNYVELSTLSS